MPDTRALDLSEDQLLERVKQGPLPRHVAVIMDGNGRWAAQRCLPRVAGHREGINSVRAVVTICRKLQIPALTIFAFSLENWRRPLREVEELMILLEVYLEKERASLREHGIRFRTIGRIDRLPPSVVHLIRSVEEETRENEGMILTIALSYGGRAEIVDAVRRLLIDVQTGRITAEKLDEETFARYLDTQGLPDPDLMIRTSGESRVSNFLLWQLAYTELYFTRTHWPDFRETDLLHALYDFQRRERRFGRVSEQPDRSDD